ncbi:MAG: DpnD/PcfM family protein [Eubacteriales bacterium]|jgi:hypothetical protein
MKYIVNVSETSFGCVTVEADNVEQAKEKAEEEYENGNIYWDNSDFSCTSVRLDKEREAFHDAR